MALTVDQSLVNKQAELRKELPETKAFMGGNAHFGLRVDEDVYEAAREENLEAMNGGNVWDEPEFRADMARRHPELMGPMRSKSFVLNASERPRVAKRNRFGKVKERTVIRGEYKITEAGNRRIYKNLSTGEYRVYDLESGELIGEGSEGSETLSLTEAQRAQRGDGFGDAGSAGVEGDLQPRTARTARTDLGGGVEGNGCDDLVEGGEG